MNNIVVIQARTNSSRLPGKVLLPIMGVPLVVLAARRAANTGLKVIVATSSECTDDSLAATIKDAGLSCFRGSLEDTLKRYVDALVGYPDETTVFRLTADNPFPDGWLLDQLAEEFEQRGLDYLCCNGVESGLPYGVSAEVTRLAHLREAAIHADSMFDREHVTPYIIRKYGACYFDKFRRLNRGHYRCTVDTFSDYLIAQQVFANSEDPVSTRLLLLIDRLLECADQPLGQNAVPRMVLGTAQLGMEYGIANSDGQPDIETAAAMVRQAIINGAGYIDTAHAYGCSEMVVGLALAGGWNCRTRLITKLSPLDECPSDAPVEVVNAFVDASVFRSCKQLGLPRIDVLMLHRAAHFLHWQGAVWKRLKALARDGVIGKLGVSVQSPEELSQSLAIEEVSHIQLPCNVLDWRWEELVPVILATRKQRSLVIHARSAYLQGLFLSENSCHWGRAGVSQPEEVIAWLQQKAVTLERQSIADLCVAYLNGVKWIDGVVIGAENREQLNINIELFSRPPLNNEQLALIENDRPILPVTTLNPSCWSAR